MLEKNGAGKNIDSYCGKCKKGRDHTIMTMDGEAIGKVRCQDCGSMHKFSDPLAEKVRKPRAKGTGEAAKVELAWASGLAGAKGKERDYDMASKYRIGEVVNHLTFGKGIVMNLHSHKCNMLFKDRERLMASTNE
jgi:hypothetical protein